MKGGVLMIYLYYGKIFISHMVQMKEKDALQLEDCGRALYPTWFRWKVKLFSWMKKGVFRFISHMVQMKAKTLQKKLHLTETFISHMVQMKENYLFFIQEKKQPLYPTWFRWKKIFTKLGQWLKKTLYPTWFRWKFSQLSMARSGAFLYIPHGSDESSRKARTAFSLISLYIPHGSDERIVRSGDKRHLLAFISHMVQMKEVPPSLSLWTRKVFISHMVQMKVLLHLLIPVISL